MELIVTNIIKLLILPPGLFFWLFAAGLLLINRRPVIGKSLLWTGLAAFYLTSTPVISGLLIKQLEIYPALNASNLKVYNAGAIVVLTSEREKNAEEYGTDTVGQYSLLRARYGAYLHHKTGLPVLVSGGFVLDTEGKSLAQTMAETLKQDFQVASVWLEEKSHTTAENALFSSEMLNQKQIDTIFLVTQAWHMPRSVAVFEATGLSVIPAPTAFMGDNLIELSGLLPNANAIYISRLALHELAGFVWYKIRYLLRQGNIKTGHSPIAPIQF